jgi:hypothetical protein
MSDKQTKALTILDIQIAEGRVFAWLSGATGITALLTLIPGFPVTAAALMPSGIVSLRWLIVSWRRWGVIRRRAAERSAP